jgi:hypothetical protein
MANLPSDGGNEPTESQTSVGSNVHLHHIGTLSLCAPGHGRRQEGGSGNLHENVGVKIYLFFRARQKRYRKKKIMRRKRGIRGRGNLFGVKGTYSTHAYLAVRYLQGFRRIRELMPGWRSENMNCRHSGG